MKIFFKDNIKISKNCLRCIDYFDNYIAVGTLDKKVFIIDAQTKKIISNFDFFEKQIYSVKFFEQDGLKLAIGSADANIYIMTINGDIQGILEGHQGIVNSLSIKNNLLASGSWDSTCKIWDLTTLENIATLTGHKYAVIVSFVFNDKIVTGSQDGILKLWGPNFEQINQQKIHDDIIRGIAVIDNETIATCSNDSSVKIIQSNLNVQECNTKHKSFIYAVHAYQNQYVLSGGEDFILKLFDKSQEIQTMPITSIVWGITSNVNLQEIYCACESGDLLVLSTNAENIDLDKHEEYVEKAKIASLGNPEFSEEQKKKFSSVKDMAQIKGKKEGEVRVFMNGEKGEAYCWQKGQWNLIGEVLGNTNKSHYEGDKYFPKGDYDFVFNIESEDGSKRLLPFNKIDNALIAAEKFLAKEQLSVGYKEQIVNFINKHAKIDKSSIQRDTEESKGMEIEESKVQKKVLDNFPVIDYVFYTKFNAQKFMEKLKEINDIYKNENSDKKLNLTDFVYIESITQKLSNCQSMNLQDIKDTELLALQRLLKWNDKNCFIVMDLLRMFCMHRDSQQLLNNVDYGAKFIIFAGSCLKNKEQKYTTLALYFFNNLFKINPLTFVKNQEIIFDMLELKTQEFSLQDWSKLITLFNQYICYFIQQGSIANLTRFYGIIQQVNLAQLLSKQNELINYVIMIGNAILFENDSIQQHLKSQEIQNIILNLNCNKPHDTLLNEIKSYLKNL